MLGREGIPVVRIHGRLFGRESEAVIVDLELIHRIEIRGMDHNEVLGWLRARGKRTWVVRIPAVDEHGCEPWVVRLERTRRRSRGDRGRDRAEGVCTGILAVIHGTEIANL